MAESYMKGVPLMKKAAFLLALLLCFILLVPASSAASMTYQEIVDLGYALEEGASLPGTYRLYGKVIRMDTAYSYQYNNVTVTMVVEGREDKPIYCYRLAGPGAPEIHVGSQITVEGKLKNYKGTIEFDAGCRLLSTMHEVLPGPNLHIQASFDKKEAVIGQPITLTFTISDCIDSYRASLTRRIYDTANGKVYTTQSIFADRYGAEIRFTPEYGSILEYDIRLFNKNNQQVFTYPISVPITGTPATAPSIQLTNYRSEIGIGEKLTVEIQTTGYFSFIEGCWYVDTGSGFYYADSMVLRGKDTVAFTPTEGTQLYFEVTGQTESGTLTARTEYIPITQVVSGDANKNGRLDLRDALLILQYDAGWQVSLNSYAADFNADGQINAGDALAVLTELAGQ